MTRICLVAFLGLMVYSLSGDTIELKTGERIEGAFKQATSAGAVIEVAGQAITIPLEKIKAIYFGAAPSATVTTSVTTAPSQEALDALTALRSVGGIKERRHATEDGARQRLYDQEGHRSCAVQPKPSQLKKWGRD